MSEIGNIASKDQQKLAFIRKKNVAKHNHALKKIDHRFKKQEKELRSEGRNRLRELRDKNREQRLQQEQLKEKKVRLIKKDLQQTQKKLANEVKNLQQSHENKVEVKRQDFKKDINEKNNFYTDKIEDLQKKGSRELTESRIKTNDKIVDVQGDHNRKIFDISHHGENKIQKLEKDYRYEFNDKEIEFNKSLLNQRFTMDNEIKDNQRKHIQEVKHQGQIHLEKKERLKLRHQQETQQMQQVFENKYKTIIKRHKEQMKHLNAMINSDISSVKQRFNKVFRTTATKENDRFYQSRYLEPSIVENPKTYTVRVKIPPHEKDYINLVVKDRLLRLNFNRSFNETIRDETGLAQKTKRFESSVKEFQVNHILDPSTIEKEYLENELVFTIKKK